MKRLWMIAVLLPLVLVACGKKAGSPEGRWTLYVPPDMVAEAKQTGKAVPEGTMDIRSDGTLTMDLTLPDGKQTFSGSWKRDGTQMTVQGKETTTGADGKEKVDDVVDTGSFSGDFTTVRVHGKDFRKTD